MATESLGYVILTLKPLGGLFASFYNTPFVGLTRFNNTMVMGGLAMGIISYVPMYALARAFVIWYRKKLQPKIPVTEAVTMMISVRVSGTKGR